MLTSYFGKLRKIPEDINKISICRNPPTWFKGKILYQTAMPVSQYDNRYKIISNDNYRTSKGMVVVISDEPLNKYSLKLLAPMSKSFNDYKADNDFDKFAKRYKEEVLWRLDANKVVEAIGENSCLLCFEVDDSECHRSIVKEWLNKKGVKCEEFE